MHNHLEKYLSKIEDQLAALPAEQRQEELREIHSHLEMMIDGNIARGCDTDKAVAEAIEQFGAADKLGKALRQSKPFALLHYFRPLGAFLFALVVVIVWVSISNEMYIPSFVPVSFQWVWGLRLIIVIFPITGWVTEVIAPKWGFWSLAVLFSGILSWFIYFAFLRFVPIPKAYFLFGFMHHALAGIASFIGVWLRRKQVERRQHKQQIIAE